MAKRIYAADDEANILNLIEMFLTQSGYEVTGFSTGDELFAKFKEDPCDLVILDVMMPGTDGLKICSKIRRFSKVPIIMLTAKDTEMDLVMGFTLGSDDYLTKPFRPTTLVMRINAIFRRIELEREVYCNNDNGAIIELDGLSYSDSEKLARYRGKDIKLTITN